MCVCAYVRMCMHVHLCLYVPIHSCTRLFSRVAADCTRSKAGHQMQNKVILRCELKKATKQCELQTEWKASYALFKSPEAPLSFPYLKFKSFLEQRSNICKIVSSNSTAANGVTEDTAFIPT